MRHHLKKLWTIMISPSLAERLLLGVILMIALLVRVWGSNFGLPYAYHPDESRFVMSAIRIVQTGDFHPQWFLQPSLHIYLLTGVYIVYFLVGVSAGKFIIVDDLFRPPYHFSGWIPYPDEYLVARWVSALIGVATIAVLYMLAKKAFDRTVALVSAGLLSFSILHVDSSHYVTNDISVTFMIVVAAYVVLIVIREGTRRHYILAGLLTGLAISTKYSAYTFILVLLAAHLDRQRRTEKQWVTGDLLLMGLALIGGVLAGTPYALLDLPGFLNGMAYEIRHHAVLGHPGAEGNSALWFADLLLTGPERYVTALGFLGLLWGSWRNPNHSRVLTLFPLVYYIVMSINEVHFKRFMVPIIPFLCLWAAAFLVRVVTHFFAKKKSTRSDRVHDPTADHGSTGSTQGHTSLGNKEPTPSDRVRDPTADHGSAGSTQGHTSLDNKEPTRSGRVRDPTANRGSSGSTRGRTSLDNKKGHTWVKPIVLGTITILLLIEPVWAVVSFDRLLSHKDVRTSALEWIDTHVPEQAMMVIEDYGPPVSTDTFTVMRVGHVIEHDLNWYLQQKYTLFVVSEGAHGRFFREPEKYAAQVNQYQDLFDRLTLVQQFEGPMVGREGYRITVYQADH